MKQLVVQVSIRPIGQQDESMLCNKSDETPQPHVRDFVICHRPPLKFPLRVCVDNICYA